MLWLLMAIYAPKIFVVPIFLGLAYVGMAYLSWTLARLILKETVNPLASARVVTPPLRASAIMLSWDVSMDAGWSTVVRAWVLARWRNLLRRAPHKFSWLVFDSVGFLSTLCAVLAEPRGFGWHARSELLECGHSFLRDGLRQAIFCC